MTGLVLLGGQAFAADLELRSEMRASGARITLGDLFEGAGPAGAVVVGAAAPAGGQAVLDAALVQAAAKRAGLVWANAEGRRRLIVASDDKRDEARQAGRDKRDNRDTGATSRTGRRQQALAYARNINAGEILAASDLVWSDEAVAPGDAVADADLAIGKAAKRPLRMGAAAAAHDLGAPRVIKREDAVQVAFEDDGVTLVLSGKAMGDAAVGDSVSVLNPASRKTIDAVAAGPGRAVVGPAAERLRAAAFPALQFAAR